MDTEPITAKIKQVLAQAEPYVIGHGGHLNFVAWHPTSGVVEVSLQGACATCSLSQITLKFGLEEALKKALPQVKEVRAL